MALDIEKIAKQGAATAFAVVSQILQDGVLRVFGAAGGYDVDTDAPTTPVSDYAVKGVAYQTREQKLSIDSARLGMILLRQEELASAGFTGSITDADKWIANGIEWNIIRAEPDPAGAIWMLEVRR